MAFEFKDNSEQIKVLTQEAIEIALLRVGIAAKQNTQKEILSHAPSLFDTEEMYRTIDYGADGVIGKEPKDHVNVGSPKDYAKFVHEGTSKITGIPFLRHALVDRAEEYKEIVSETLASKFK